MIRDPRLAFDQLFGSGGTPEERAESETGQPEHPRLDPGGGLPAQEDSGTERSKATRRLSGRTFARSSGASRRSRSATRAARRGSFPRAHRRARLATASTSSSCSTSMALAFMTDMTRVFSFKIGRDGSGRVYPESGVDDRLPPRFASPRPGEDGRWPTRRSTGTT